MARDDFFLSVRNAIRFLAPALETDGAALNGNALAQRLRQATTWLTPRSVAGFKPDDFLDLPPEQRDELRHAVELFRAVAAEVPAPDAATPEQLEKALPSFLRIVALVQQLSRREWLDALAQLVQEAETWARKQDWATRRDTKQVTDKFLGVYEAPRLLIHTLDGRLLLEPVARYVTGANGLVELCALPSYDAVRITRADDGWDLHADAPHESVRKWSEEAFVTAVRNQIRTNEKRTVPAPPGLVEIP